MSFDNALRESRNSGRDFSRIKNVRIFIEGYEYRLNYLGGFAEYIQVDRRAVGTRNFTSFWGYGAYACRSTEEALEKCVEELKRALAHNTVNQVGYIRV